MTKSLEFHIKCSLLSTKIYAIQVPAPVHGICLTPLVMQTPVAFLVEESLSPLFAKKEAFDCNRSSIGHVRQF